MDLILNYSILKFRNTFKKEKNKAQNYKNTQHKNLLVEIDILSLLTLLPTSQSPSFFRPSFIFFPSFFSFLPPFLPCSLSKFS